MTSTITCTASTACAERVRCESCGESLCPAHDVTVTYCGREYFEPVPVHDECHEDPCSIDCQSQRYYSRFGA